MDENESVRRSSRSNKGVHTKRHEIETVVIDEPRKKVKIDTGKDSGTTTTTTTTARLKTSQPAYVHIEGEVVRCLPCGTTDLNYNEEDDDPNGMMIECDSCHTWQHVKCMFGTQLKKNKLPENYKCDVCDPLNPIYNKLRRKLAYARYLKLRLNNDNKILETEDDDNNDDLKDSGAINDNNDDEYEESSKKKNQLKKSNDKENIGSDDDNLTDEENKHSKKKSIHKKKTIKSPKVEKEEKKSHIYKYDTIHSKITQNLEIKLVELLPKTNNESLLNGKSIGELAKEWANILEREIHLMFPNYELDHTKYTERARSLLTNLKISKLVDRVINGEFKIEQLPKLTVEEMRTPEEKKKADELMQKALEKVVIKNDVSTLPKTRVTHKGVEIVGDADYQFDINDKRNSEVEKIKESMKKEAPSPPLPSPPQREEYNNGWNVDNESENEEKIGSGIDTIKSSGLSDDETFNSILNDGKKSESNSTLAAAKIKEKEKEKEKQKKERAKRHQQKKKEIEMLKLAKHDLWEGNIGTPELSFKCKIDFITSTFRSKLSDKEIKNAKKMINDCATRNNGFVNKGRLKSRVADEYLDKITSSRDLYLFDVLPFDDNEETNSRFMKMWSYYHSASRYAVMKNSVSYIKDVYLMVLSREQIMEGKDGALTLNNFQNDVLADHLDENTREMKLYLVFVAQKNMDKISLQPAAPAKTVPTVEVNNSNSNSNDNNNNKENEDDDDYNPALSVTLSKLSGEPQQSADSVLENIMKNL